jgi:putrescine aminotransferase
VIRSEGGEFAHGYTYSGHPAACAVALANIAALEGEGVIDRVRTEIAPYFAERIGSLRDHPLVGEARTVGLMGAVEIVADKTTGERFHKDLNVGTRCRNFCFANGLVMRAVGDSMIVAPPLVISKDQVDELVEKARRCLDLTADWVRGQA